MTPIPVLVTEDGLHAREVNPYGDKEAVSYDTLIETDNVQEQIHIHAIKSACLGWKNFEATVKTYDLTHYCTPGSVINAVLVWQYRLIKPLNDREWETLFKESYALYNSYNEFYSFSLKNNIEVREAYQPIPITDADKIVSDKPKEETVEEAALLFNKEHPEMDSWSSFIAGTEYILKQQYNKGVEDAIEILNDSPTCFRNRGWHFTIIEYLKQLIQKP